MPALGRVAVPAAFAALAFAILVGLGFWQLDRLAWKEALIARVTERLGDLPVAAPPPSAWADLDLAAVEYTPVEVHGRYLNDKEIAVVHTLTAPKGPLGGVGYFIMTPFRTDEGWLVYVNRGFVPKDRKSASSRESGLIDGPTTVVGLLRQPAERSWFMPGDAASANEWFSREPALFAAASGFPAGEIAPYLIDLRFDPALPGGLPQGGETPIAFPNNHLQYAVTWFGLAAALVGVFVVFIVGRIRRGG